MISFDDVRNGLYALGFESGWAYTNIGYPEGILIWEHDKPLPSLEEVKKAAPLWVDTIAKREAADQARRETILKRIGLTVEELSFLLEQ